jgi:hypothetical protein
MHEQHDGSVMCTHVSVWDRDRCSIVLLPVLCMTIMGVAWNSSLSSSWPIDRSLRCCGDARVVGIGGVLGRQGRAPVDRLCTNCTVLLGWSTRAKVSLQAMCWLLGCCTGCCCSPWWCSLASHRLSIKGGQVLHLIMAGGQGCT